MPVSWVSWISCRFPSTPSRSTSRAWQPQAATSTLRKTSPSVFSTPRQGLPWHSCSHTPRCCSAGEAGALGWGRQALGHSWNVSFNRTSGQRQAGECAGGSQPSAVQACLWGGGQGFPGGQNAKAKRPKPNGPSLSPVWLTFKQKLRYLKEIVSLQE